MSTVKKKSPTNQSKPKAILVYVGLVIIAGWIVLSACLGIGQTLKCDLTPNTCATPDFIYNLIMTGPIVIGSLLLSLGLIRTIKGIAIKFLFLLAAVTVLTTFGYMIMALLTVLIHGIK